VTSLCMTMGMEHGWDRASFSLHVRSTSWFSECQDNAAVVQTDASFPECFLNNQGAVVPQSKYCSQPRIASISVLLSAIGTKSLVTADFASAR
jgi:hypothetical protein